MSRFNRALEELRHERVGTGMEVAKDAFARPTVVRIRATRALVALGAAGLAAALTLIPRAPAVASMSLVQAVSDAAERAPRSHTRWYSLDPDKKEFATMEQWHDGVRMRNDFIMGFAKPDIQHAFDGKRQWSRYSRRHYVSVRDSKGFGNQNGGETLTQLAKSLRQGGKRIEVRKVEIDGRPMLELVHDWNWTIPGNRPKKGRTVWLADPDRKLPREVRNYNLQGEKWVQVGRAEFEYPTEPLPDDLFQLPPRAGEKLFDKDVERRALPSIWAKGLGSQRVLGQEIVLRDVVADRYATLAVVWTGGPRLPSASVVTVTDATGRRTVGVPYLPYIASKDNRHPESLLLKIEGKPNRMAMLGAWKGAYTLPLRIEIPVANGRSRAKATFTVRELRQTDQLVDLAGVLGANDRSVGETRAIAVTR